MARRILALLLLLLPFALFAQAQTIPDSQLVLLKNDSPLIAFRVLFLTGSAHDPKDKEGIAALTAAMLAEAGTQKNDYQKILQLLYPMAAEYTDQTDKEMTVIRGQVHKDNLMPYYQLLRDAILSPAFKQEDFDRLKTDQFNYVSKSLRFNDDEELGKEVLNAMIFKDHPYGHPDLGTASSVQSLTMDDVKAFYKQEFTRNNVWIGVAGNFGDDLVAQIKKDFAMLPEGSSAQMKLPDATKVEGAHATIVGKDAPATAMSFGFPVSFTRADDDYYPMMLAASWLGQHRNSFSHLYQAIRETRGMNYGDYAYVEHFPAGGRNFQPRPNFARHEQIFEVWIRPVLNKNRHFALRAAVREVQKLVDNGMTAEDFKLAQNFLLNYSSNLAQSNSDQLGYALDDRFYGLSKPFLQQVKERIPKLTLDQVNGAIKKYLNTANVDFAFVGADGDALKKELAEDAPSPIIYDAPKPDPVLQEDKTIEKYPVKIPADNITVVAVDKVFE